MCSFMVDATMRREAPTLHEHGGSPIGSILDDTCYVRAFFLSKIP